MKRRLLFSLVLVALMVAALPAGAGQQGYHEGEFEYGFFYGTFDQSPNTAMFAGGPIESFCGPEESSIPERVFERKDGRVDIWAEGSGQPIFLYETEANDIPTWLYAPGGVCEAVAGGAAPPTAFASGEARVKVRMTVNTDGAIDIVNSSTGWAVGTDGTRYRVRGTADLKLVDEMPQGDPRDFVGFKLRTLGG